MYIPGKLPPTELTSSVFLGLEFVVLPPPFVSSWIEDLHHDAKLVLPALHPSWWELWALPSLLASIVFFPATSLWPVPSALPLVVLPTGV